MAGSSSQSKLKKRALLYLQLLLILLKWPFMVLWHTVRIFWSPKKDVSKV